MAERAQLPPNIIVILADDLGWSQLGCYGSNFYKTPHIDKLAKEGMRFTDAYSAAAVCSPTRASIMTGKYPARLHLTDFLPGNKETNYSLLEPEWQKFLPLEEVTIAEMLKQHGYATAHFGKWHLSIDKRPPTSEPYNPDKQGFDEFFITYKPKPNALPNDAHNVAAITEKSLNFMERKQYEPFFLFVSHNSIHDPLVEQAETINLFQTVEAQEQAANNPTIGAMLSTLDNSVGKIMEQLNTLGLTEQTLVVFYSDNGGKEAHAAQTPLKKGKGWLYEGGIRVPLIAKWPTNIEPNSTAGDMVSSIDLFPTIMDVAGIGEGLPNFDGLSLIDVFKNVGNLDRDMLYWHYPHYHKGSSMVPAGAIRQGKYKLIQWYEKYLTGASGQVELYDLSKDIGETRNLADDMPDKAEELRQKFGNWRRNVGGQMPDIHPNYGAIQ